MALIHSTLSFKAHEYLHSKTSYRRRHWGATKAPFATGHALGTSSAGSSNTVGHGWAPWQRCKRKYLFDSGSNSTIDASFRPVSGGSGLNSLSPPMTEQKFNKLQRLRVNARVSYTSGVGLCNLFDATELYFKKLWPDVIVKKCRIPLAIRDDFFEKDQIRSTLPKTTTNYISLSQLY